MSSPCSHHAARRSETVAAAAPTGTRHSFNTTSRFCLRETARVARLLHRVFYQTCSSVWPRAKKLEQRKDDKKKVIAATLDQ